MERAANTHEATNGFTNAALAAERGLMSSKFVILTPARTIVERVYSGTSAEQFEAYVAEFPIGSGHSLRYTMSLAPIQPLVMFG